MNSYITEIPSLLDVSFFQKIANEIITEEWLSLSDPAALSNFTDKMPVSIYDYEYLKRLKEQYPSLDNQIKFMKSKKGSWPIHVDRHRKCAINIPITNSLDTVTKFYINGHFVDSIETEFGDVFGVWYSNEYLTYVVDAEESFDHILTVPTLINTSIPHGIVNNGIEPRIICSWAYNGTYEKALKEFNV